ncbi:triose-phosphate isomerase [Sporosarcina ureilytica]|uniref:triose-phosphate isomerase n=1 Tax=Sporosarcina ureilytica TaxID=298596 RepID=UPI000A3F3793|nr:triose-phosphate isomerase [Sporosarcina ureilytica]
MVNKKIKAPFFVVNPKSFLFGESLMDLARHADQLAEEYPIDILFTAPLTELAIVAKECQNLIVTAQHMDNIECGDSMGRVFAESLKHIGVQAVVLNHADNPMSCSDLSKAIQRAKDVGLLTIVCADSGQEGQALAVLGPDIVLAEPTELIGSHQISDRNYVISTIEKIKKINPCVLVEQGAGIRSAQDVAELLRLGADGVGVTSGIVKAEKPIEMMKEMIEVVAIYGKKGSIL